jgi:predicted enzyme related to lactoylglutathione lyase
MRRRCGAAPAITLFAEDLAATKEFYKNAFGLPVHYEDDASAAFNFGNTLISLLKAEEAVGLIAPRPVAAPAAGARAQLTITVDDVNATCAELTKRGVKLFDGPMDRPWGTFASENHSRALSCSRSSSRSSGTCSSCRCGP